MYNLILMCLISYILLSGSYSLNLFEINNLHGKFQGTTELLTLCLGVGKLIF